MYGVVRFVFEDLHHNRTLKASTHYYYIHKSRNTCVNNSNCMATGYIYLQLCDWLYKIPPCSLEIFVNDLFLNIVILLYTSTY